jgi:hypothetical protein
MERAYLLGLGLAAFGGTLLCLRHRSPLHLLVLLATFTLFVGNFFPIATLFIEPSSWRNVVQAPDRDILAVQTEYAAFAFGLFGAALSAFALGGLARVPRKGANVGLNAGLNVDEHADTRRARPERSDAWVATILVLGGAVLYALFVHQVGFDALSSRDDYAEKYLKSVGLGPLASGINVMIAGVLWAEAGVLGPRARNLFRAVGLAIAAWSLLVISVRTNFVILALGYGWIVCVRRDITIARVRPALVVMALGGWFGLELVSLWRGAVKEAGLDRATEILVRNVDANLSAVVGGSEFSHPFLTALEVRTHEREGELGGASYWNAVPALAPLALVPDRPAALAESFARSNYGAFAESGGGTAFSLVAEAWWNFGTIAGSLFVGFVCGLLLLALEGAAARGPAGALARVVPYFTFLCVTAHRSESAVLLKQMVVLGLPIAAVLILADLLQPLARRPARCAPIGSA